MDTLTIQRCEIESKDGKKFLRKVIRDHTSYRNGWSIYASSETNWCFELRRTIAGALGESDTIVFVRTDAECRLPRERDTGDDVKPFGDAEPVFVPEPVSVRMRSSDCAIACRALINGETLRIVAHAGSTSSSKHGLAFLSLTSSVKGIDDAQQMIGSESVFVNGQQVISGAVNVR